MKTLLIGCLLLSPAIVIAAGPAHQHLSQHAPKTPVIVSPSAVQGSHNEPTFHSRQRPAAPEYRPQARMLNQGVAPSTPVIIHYHYPAPTRFHSHQKRQHPTQKIQLSGSGNNYSFHIQQRR